MSTYKKRAIANSLDEDVIFYMGAKNSLDNNSKEFIVASNLKNDSVNFINNGNHGFIENELINDEKIEIKINASKIYSSVETQKVIDILVDAGLRINVYKKGIDSRKDSVQKLCDELQREYGNIIISSNKYANKIENKIQSKIVSAKSAIEFLDQIKEKTASKKVSI